MPKLFIRTEGEIKTAPNKQNQKNLSPVDVPYKKCKRESFRLKGKDAR